jgi:hypothetical protein
MQIRVEEGKGRKDRYTLLSTVLLQHLLPIVYYHVVFTLPEELNAVALINQEIVYELLSRQYSVRLV